MARRRKIDSHTEEILRKFNLDPKECLWDCHGSWILLHKWVVVIGQRAGITLSPPQIINADQNGRMGLVLVEGKLNDQTAWSFGEAAPYNNKNAYPFAMAEKRAKDRVILELIGLAGHVYTDQDVAEIKEGKPVWELKPEPASQSDVNTTGIKHLFDAIDQCETADQFANVAQRIKEGVDDGDISDTQRQALRIRFAARKCHPDVLTAEANAPEDPEAEESYKNAMAKDEDPLVPSEY